MASNVASGLDGEQKLFSLSVESKNHIIPTLVTRTKEMAYANVLVLFLELCRYSKMKEHPLGEYRISEHERWF